MSGLWTVTPFVLGSDFYQYPSFFFMLYMIGALGMVNRRLSCREHALGMAAQAIGIDAKKYEHLDHPGDAMCRGPVVMIGFSAGKVRARRG